MKQATKQATGRASAAQFIKGGTFCEVAKRARAGRACYIASAAGHGWRDGAAVELGKVNVERQGRTWPQARAVVRLDKQAARLGAWVGATVRHLCDRTAAEGWRVVEVSERSELEAIARKWGNRALRLCGTVPGIRSRSVLRDDLHEVGDDRRPASVRSAVWWLGFYVETSAAGAARIGADKRKARKRRRAPLVRWTVPATVAAEAKRHGGDAAPVWACGAWAGRGAWVRAVWQWAEVSARSQMRSRLWGKGWEGAEVSEVSEFLDAPSRHLHAEDCTPRTMLRDGAAFGLPGTGSAAPLPGPVRGMGRTLRGLRIGLACFWAGGLVTVEDCKRGQKAGQSQRWGKALADDLRTLAAFAKAAGGEGVAEVCALGLGRTAADESKLRTGDRRGQLRADKVPGRLQMAAQRIVARAAAGLHLADTDGAKARQLVALVETLTSAQGVTLRALELHLRTRAACIVPATVERPALLAGTVAAGGRIVPAAWSVAAGGTSCRFIGAERWTFGPMGDRLPVAGTVRAWVPVVDGDAWAATVAARGTGAEVSRLVGNAAARGGAFGPMGAALVVSRAMADASQLRAMAARVPVLPGEVARPSEAGRDRAALLADGAGPLAARAARRRGDACGAAWLAHAVALLVPHGAASAEVRPDGWAARVDAQAAARAATVAAVDAARAMADKRRAPLARAVARAVRRIGGTVDACAAVRHARRLLARGQKVRAALWMRAAGM